MDICVIIPVKSFDQAKSRLSGILNREQRRELSRLLMQDTLNTLMLCRELTKIIVVSSDPAVKEIASHLGLECLLQSEDRGVNSAIKYADKHLSVSGNGNWVSITIPCDLPLLLPKDIDGVCQVISKEAAGVIVSPSYKFDGTNLLARNPFNIINNTRYDNDSFRGHLEASIEVGANTRVLLSTRLMIDLDTSEDLRLVLSNAVSAKKSISYLWKIKNNHFSSSFTSTTIRTETGGINNKDPSDLASTSVRDLWSQ
jgi:2-phospho-L-lactate/phosphoenolpyruvate guanylyltransferase